MLAFLKFWSYVRCSQDFDSYEQDEKQVHYSAYYMVILVVADEGLVLG